MNNSTENKVTAIVQARMASTRLPKKVLLPLEGKPVLWQIINRLKYCKNVDRIIIATSTNPMDNEIEEFARKENIPYFRGSENDLVERFYGACKSLNINHFIRVTGDCPFVDPSLVDAMIDFYFKNKEKCDLLSNVHPPTYPDGLDLEIIPFEAIKRLYSELKDPFYRECFTRYLFEISDYKKLNYENNENLSEMRWTLDTPEDYAFFKVIYHELFERDKVFLKDDILTLLKKNPEYSEINNKFERNYAYYKDLENKSNADKELGINPPKNGMKKKVLVIGCGSMGMKHLKNLSSFFDLDVIACDAYQAALDKIKVELPMVRLYSDYESALIQEKPEYVIVATPNHLHLNFATKALKYTQNILIEKPLSHNLEKIDQFVDEAKKNQVNVFVGFNMRFHPIIQRIKEIVDNGKLGKIFTIKINFGSYLPDRHPGKDYTTDYVTKEALGGGVILDVSHELDYLVWIFGKPEEIFSFAEKRSDLIMETEDSADILLKINSHCIANVHLDMLRRPYTRTCEIIGENGTLLADIQEGEIKIYAPEEKKWSSEKHLINHNETYVEELNEFLDIKQKKNLAELNSAKKVLDIAFAAKESSNTKVPVILKTLIRDRKDKSNYSDEEMLEIKRSIELFKEAQQLIPCQTQTLSKGPSQFVKGVSPVFLKSGKGSHVWDVDGNEFIDYILALGPITLGYDYPITNQAVIDQLHQGITFSLPHPLEIELAKEIIRIIPCAEMVRYGKNGTDVTSAAIRYARCYTGREKIAYCGYHGGSADWFGITTALNKGIPSAMKDFMFKFEYNKLETLEKIFKEQSGKIAAVIMEPVVYEEPLPGFLEGVKKMASENGAVLIFDEMVSGFRVSLGGAQQYYNVIPDLSTFGKGVANGMPLSLLVGKKEIMQEGENTFFSMTFGGETLSLAAALATIKEMKDKKVIEHLWKQGTKLKKEYNSLAQKYSIESFTRCTGLPVHTQFEFIDKNNETWYDLKSLFIQETVRRGILFSGVNNISLSHSDEDMDKTLKAVEEAFIILKKGIEEDKVREMIEGAPIRPMFKRN